MFTFGTTGGGQGFALLATPDNHWAALVGNGAALDDVIKHFHNGNGTGP
jgi:hypothetical protein